MIERVVITAAGLGTRLLPMSKELPKEMLPIFVESENGPILKPMLQALFEQLYTFGVRAFSFVVGPGKRAIEDHFTPDYDLLEELCKKGKSRLVIELESFYKKVENSRVFWVNQPQPRGFGDAVLKTEGLVSEDDFMVAAGDTYIISERESHLKRLVETHLDNKADVSFLVMNVPDPENYGIAEIAAEEKCLRVLSVAEKPAKPKTQTAIMPFYVFKPIVFEALKSLKPGVGREIQLTDAIDKLIESGHQVYATRLREDEVRLDIGTPESYWHAISQSYKFLASRRKL
jgi:UTP--glucose-1-phosphate uridylyltransferase